MKKIVIILFLIFSTIVRGQNSTSNFPTVPVPNFVPPSPEAFSMTKYGDIPINEFTGLLNVSVPIYTYKSGNLKLPISLSYNGAGFKIDDIPTKVGMNWNLNAGGIITRTIKDMPDEKVDSLSRIYLSQQEITDQNTPDGTSGAAFLSNIIENTEIDSEADIFNYSFGNYSGSFILDQNLHPILLKEESELKISSVDDDLSSSEAFVITTPDGVQYFFGGTKATEISFSSGNNHQNSYYGVTSYYLTRILDPINGEILFDYNTAPEQISFLGRNESISFLTADNFPLMCRQEMVPPNTIAYGGETLHVSNCRSLKRIYSSLNNQFINLNYEIVGDKNILNEIDINSNDNNQVTLLNQIILNYIGLTDFENKKDYKRFFLSEVIFNNELKQNPEKIQKWEFEYESPLSIPDRLSFAQDYYGYYNGKDDNTMMLPVEKIDFDYLGTVSYIFPGADRTPNFDTAKMGTLIKVKYPTRGYSTIEYEPNPVTKEVTTSYNIQMNTQIGLVSDYLTNDPTVNLEGNSLNTIYKTQLVKINYALESTSIWGNHINDLMIEISNLTDSTQIIPTQRVISGSSISTGFFNVDLHQGDQYKFHVYINDPTQIPPGETLTGNINFELITGIEITQGDGLRVKKQVDYADDNTVSNYKRYYYMGLNLINLPLDQQPIHSEIKPDYLKYSMVWKNLSNSCLASIASVVGGAIPDASLDAHFANYTTISSNALSCAYESFAGGHVLNPIVTTSYGGDNFEDGGIERFYYLDSNYNAYTQVITQNIDEYNGPFNTAMATNDFIKSSITNLNMLNGDLINEYYFKKNRDGEFIKLKQTQLKYDRETIPVYANVIGKRVYVVFYYQPNIVAGTTTSNYFLKIYNTLAFRNRFICKTEKTYFEDIVMPQVTYDSGIEVEPENYSIVESNNDNNAKKSTITENYKYDVLRGLPTEIYTTTSDSNRLLKTKNYYPNDVAELSGLSTLQQSECDHLMNQNRLAKPVQVEQYQNNELLSTQRTLYKEWSNTGERVLPEIIQISKGANLLEDRVVYSEYDSNGNPTIVSLKDGTKTKYFYNSLNQVILKVENYNTSLNIPDSPDLSDPCGFIHQYPSAMVSIYNYDPITNQIVSIVAPNCVFSYYEYDALHQLKYIRDNDHNILQEFDHNYKPQN